MVREVVAEVWRLFRARFWRVLVTVAILLAPLELGVALLDPDSSSLAHGGWWVWVAASASVTVLAYPWVMGALVHDVAMGDRTPVHAYRRTGSKLPDLMASALVTTIGILAGTIALIIPGLFLLARWALVVPLIVLDGDSWRAALSRSNDLVRGRTWSVAGIFVLLTVIGFALAVVPAGIGYALGNVLGAWLAALAIDTVLVAFYAFAPFVLHRRFTD